MKKVLRIAGQVLVIAAITLALDFLLTATVFNDMARTFSQADAANLNAYIHTSYDHDLAPNQKSMRLWGKTLYSWQTDRYGFRTGTCAPGEAEKDWPAVFVIGDSFTEALGSTYEKSFVGLMACDAARQKTAVWNLGVASYSPAIYHLKLRAAATRLGLKPAEVFVFLDLSDIDDDANVYKVEENGEVGRVGSVGQGGSPPFDWGQLFLNNFSTARFLYDLFLTSSFSYSASLGRTRARWSIDPQLMASWGRRGLAIADANMDKLVGVCREWHCRVTLIVYPWPDNVAAGDRDSIQVTHWRDWAARNDVRFVDGFAPFFREPAESVIRKYYIEGDVHFTDLGNQLLFDEVKQAVGGEWAGKAVAHQ